MNNRVAKKIRRKASRDYKDTLKSVLRLPWYQRVQWAWFVVCHHLPAQ